MSTKNDIKITASCRIRPNKAWKNNEPYFGTGENNGFTGFIKSIYKHINPRYPKFYKMDPLSRLGFITAELLLTGYHPLEKYPDHAVGIILANASSSVDIDRSFQQTIDDRDDYFPSPGLFVYTLPNIMAGEIAIRHKLKGENSVFIQPTFSMEFIRDYVVLLFEKNKIECCVTGWIEVNADHYDALMMIVEKQENVESMPGMPFSVTNIEKLYN